MKPTPYPEPTRARPSTGKCPAARRRPGTGSRCTRAPVGVHDDAGHRAAAHRYRHHQRAVGQVRVVVLTQGEPQHPA